MLAQEAAFRRKELRRREARMVEVYDELAGLAERIVAAGLTARPDGRDGKPRCNTAWSILFFLRVSKQRTGKHRTRARTGSIQVAEWWPSTGRLRVGTMRLVAETAAQAVEQVIEWCGAPGGPGPRGEA